MKDYLIGLYGTLLITAAFLLLFACMPTPHWVRSVVLGW